MKYFILLLLFCISSSTLNAQSKYKDLSSQAIDYIERDSFEQAEVLLKQAMNLEPANPYNALLFTNLGLIQKRMGRYEQAIESYTLAINMAPEVIPVILDRAALYAELGMNDRAFYDYTKVLDLDVNNKEALLMRAYIYMLRRDYKLANTDFRNLLKLDSNHYNARLGLITLKQKEKNFKEALEDVNKMLLDYSQDAVLYVARADIEREMEYPDLAITDLDEAIRISPDLVDAYLLRGDIYLLQGKKSQAKSDFEKAVRLGVPYAQLSERINQCKK